MNCSVHVTFEDGHSEHRALGDLVVPFLRLLFGNRLEVKGHALIVRATVIAITSRNASLRRETETLFDMRNLSAGYDFLRISITLDGKLLYQHPHPLAEVILPGLHDWLGRPHRGKEFCLKLAGSDECLVVRAPPVVEGESTVVAQGAKRSFVVRPIADAPLAETPIERWGALQRVASDLDPDVQLEEPTGPVQVLVTETVSSQLLQASPFSTQFEEGGFLVGCPYLDPSSGNFIVHLTDAVPAEHTGASLLDFTLTGDSFEAIKRTLHGESGSTAKRLVGWYHTHLFSASASFGLSSVDIRTHFSTFRKEWQLAGLVNIDPINQKRALRFYVRSDMQMLRCSQWLLQETRSVPMEQKVESL